MSRWVLVCVCALACSVARPGELFGRHFPQGSAAVEYAYGPDGLWRDTAGIEHLWSYNDECATAAHPPDLGALLRYGASHNVTSGDAECALFGDANNDGDIQPDEYTGFAFFEHAGQGPKGVLTAPPFYHFWFDDNWLAGYMADAYGRPRPTGAVDRGERVRWRLLGGDNRYWSPYAASGYLDRIALNAIYKLNAGDFTGALADWNAMLASSGAVYNWDDQRFDYPSVKATYQLSLWAILSERLLAARASFPARNDVLQHAMAQRSQLLSLQQRDDQGRLLGWITDIDNPRSLMNTETLALGVLALGAGAHWVFEPGYAPMWSAAGNYFLRPHNALSAVVGLSKPGHIVYGPYWTLPAGYYEVEFALRTPSNAPPTRADLLATLDIYDGTSILRLTDIRLASMPGRNQWQRYKLTVRIDNPSNRMEFRVYWHGRFNLDVGPVRVTKTEPAPTRVVYRPGLFRWPSTPAREEGSRR